MNNFLLPLHEYSTTPILLHIGSSDSAPVSFTSFIWFYLQITCFETRNILRPAYFVPTSETNSSYIRWCKNTQFDVGKPVFFWCFPYGYCDRSRWNTISTSDEEFFNIPRDVRDTIAKLANIGDNEEESDDEDSTDSSNKQDDI